MNKGKKIIDKHLIDLEISKTQLAKELGVSRVHLTNVINGKKKSPDLEKRIYDFILKEKEKRYGN